MDTVFYREDLNRGSQNLPFEDVSIANLRHPFGIGAQIVHVSSRVLFIDGGRYKLLKDRHQQGVQ